MGELGLGLQDSNLTVAVWDVPLLPDSNSGSADAMESVVDNIDSNDNVYDVYYDEHKYEDTGAGSPDVATPEASWHRINHGPPGRGRILSVAIPASISQSSEESYESSLLNAYNVYS